MVGLIQLILPNARSSTCAAALPSFLHSRTFRARYQNFTYGLQNIFRPTA